MTKYDKQPRIIPVFGSAFDGHGVLFQFPYPDAVGLHHAGSKRIYLYQLEHDGTQWLYRFSGYPSDLPLPEGCRIVP